MKLSQKVCTACHNDVPALSDKEAAALLGELSGWAISEDKKWLVKHYKFRNFVKALAFVNAVGNVAEAENHHPDIALGWGYADVRLQTHHIGGLHENDFIVAAKIDAITAE